MIEKKTVSQCISSDYCAGWNDAVDEMPRWISVEERLPEHWRMDDKGRTLINYLVYSPDYGVDVGNYIKSAKRWVCMGLPMNVTHWMPLPEPPEVEHETVHDCNS